MASYPPILGDDLTSNHHARHAYTTFEYEILGLNPNVDFQAYVFPPLPPAETAPCLLSSPLLQSLSYPISGRSRSSPSHFNRSMCDLYTPSYELKSTLWTPDGEVPDVDDSRGVVPVNVMDNLARCFPQYGHLVSAANSHDQKSAKKVRDLIVRYIKEERDKSWGSTTINPSGLIWQIPALDEAEDDVQEKEISTLRTQSRRLLNSKGRDGDIKFICRKQRSSKQNVVLRSKKRVRPRRRQVHA